MEGCNWIGRKFHLSVNRHGRVSLWDSVEESKQGMENGEVTLELEITEEQAQIIRAAQQDASA